MLPGVVLSVCGLNLVHPMPKNLMSIQATSVCGLILIIGLYGRWMKMQSWWMYCTLVPSAPTFMGALGWVEAKVHRIEGNCPWV